MTVIAIVVEASVSGPFIIGRVLLIYTQEMKKNGAELIHFATGFIVGYPPCPYISQFKDLIREKYGLRVIIGTHPIPQKYYTIHSTLGTWESREFSGLVIPTLASEKFRLLYD